MAHFTCGCCGSCFQSTHEVQDKFDQDRGYGICPRCDEWISGRNEKEWQKTEKLVADALSEKNRKSFLSMETEVRRGLCLEMMDAGLITWTIK